MADIHYVTFDTETLRRQILTELENAVGVALMPGDEMRMFAEGLVYLLQNYFAYIDDAIRQSHLRYARGENLDAIGETRGGIKLKRTEATPAQTRLRFEIKKPRQDNIYIDRGVRATYDGIHYFATKYNCAILAGETSVEVEAESTLPGSEYNGILPGLISKIVDRDRPTVNNIDKVVNLDETHSGADREDDEHYRERIRKYPDSFSTAGPAKAYQYWAMEAHPDVVDAVAVSDSEIIEADLPVYDHHAFFCAYGLLGCVSEYPYDYEDDLMTFHVDDDSQTIHVKVERSMRGKVKIIPICKGGELPSQDILNAVLQTCSQPDIRPLTDVVMAEAPVVVPYYIDLVVYVRSNNYETVRENIEGEGGAIDRYRQWQDETMNEDINPDQLRKLILCPDWTDNRQGADRVEILSPTFTPTLPNQIPKCQGVNIRYEVLYG